tara:strand:- start:39 stop:305 length:267 start_codon:yes stop_codon:yes gene_type:complete
MTKTNDIEFTNKVAIETMKHLLKLDNESVFKFDKDYTDFIAELSYLMGVSMNQQRRREEEAFVVYESKLVLEKDQEARDFLLKGMKSA